MNRDYNLIPPNSKVLHIDQRQKFSFTLNYKPKPRLRTLTEKFKAESFIVKGLKSQGVRLSTKEVKSIEVTK
jgi:topoisomerase-4 subunit A